MPSSETQQVQVPAPPPPHLHENDYVYVECTPNIDSMQETRLFDMQGNASTIHHSQISYSNQLNTITQLSNGYTIQNLHMPTSVQFQSYHAPLQLSTSNHLTPCSQMVSGK